MRDLLLEARERDKKNAKRKKRPVCSYVITYGGYAVGSIKKAFRGTALEAGFDDVTPYTIRHSFAIWQAQNGVSFFQIAKFLGTSVEMVERIYAHPYPNFLKKAAKSIAKAIEKVKEKAKPLSLRKGGETQKELLAARRAVSSMLGIGVSRAAASGINVGPAPHNAPQSGQTGEVEEAKETAGICGKSDGGRYRD